MLIEWQTEILLVVLFALGLLFRQLSRRLKPGEHPKLYKAFVASGGRDPTTFAPGEFDSPPSVAPRRHWFDAFAFHRRSGRSVVLH